MDKYILLGVIFFAIVLIRKLLDGGIDELVEGVTESRKKAQSDPITVAIKKEQSIMKENEKLKNKWAKNKRLKEKAQRVEKWEKLLEEPIDRKVWNHKYSKDSELGKIQIALEDELLKNEKTDIEKVKQLVDQKNKIIDGDPKHKRHSVPKKVQDRVWNRDGGKCVECGSNENLEFDHIIPVSKGGANTYRNIQLLCGTCNRSKSDKIG